jgi:hypothetical protein
MKKIGAAVLAAAALAGSMTGTAQAEYNPRCASGVTQIGSTLYLQWRGENVASVKQFKGCGKNWGYIYVWDSWRAGHQESYWISTGIRTRTSESSIDYVKVQDKKELWSSGADTLSECTQAGGAIWNDTTITVGNWTEERC